MRSPLYLINNKNSTKQIQTTNTNKPKIINNNIGISIQLLQKGGVPAAPSGTATLLRLSPSYRFYPNTLLNGYMLQVPPASMA